MLRIVLVVHNVRSAHNVGSIMRTCDGLGIEKLYLSGYTPYPSHKADSRLPHEAVKLDRQIQKTALGAEKSLQWQYQPDVNKLIERFKTQGYQLIGLEQASGSIELDKFMPRKKLALFCGSEIGGLPREITNRCNQLVHIPMLGKKESFNVAIASAIALYHLRYIAK